MKLKLPFTERFLIKLFNLIEELLEGDTGSSTVFDLFSLKSIGDVVYPDYRKLRIAYEKRNRREQFNKMISYLKSRGYLKIKKIKNKSGLILTPKSLDKILQIKFKTTERKQRKDKKWQMVIFDVPEKRRSDRDNFRQSLRYLGYQMLQKSIWICPNDVLKETQKLIRQFDLEAFVKLLLIEEIEIE